MAERRYTTDSIEARGMGTGMVISGHASMFDVPYELYGFTEQVARGAFKKSIRESDVHALWNHNPNMVLGYNRSKTLTLEEDALGLAYTVEFPDAQDARDLYARIERGDVTKSSFAFDVVKEKWAYPEGEKPQRTLREVRLFDVSPVTYPASPTTDVDIVRAMRSLSECVDVPLEELIEAAKAGDLTRMWTPNATTDTTATTQEEEPEPEQPEQPEPHRMLIGI